MFDKMKELMEFKKQAERIKKELEETLVENEDNGIKIVVNGAQELKSISIDAGRLGVDKKAGLEADLLKGVNAAIRKSQNVATQKMSSVLPRM